MTIMHAEPRLKTYRVISPGVQIFGLALCVALTAVAIRIPDWIPRICGFFTGFVALLLLFFRETRIDIQRGVVVEVCRILGVIPFSRRERRMQEYAGISCHCSSGVTNDISDTWTVALHPRSGRAVALCQFSVTTGSKDCPKARAFACELSRETGLELIDYVA
ncbi:hypothetical protein [Pedosphaera parvula]|uniref:Uncharacterized protein n=1 Tax=Pedosphaera parvula (strain Ellin514) TaxID=320771 RepID=B9XHP1_PEDPL|nr:hypothetical protein [Pedosphaera parvula]EEF60619.1 hypothetical protein Cflav_PD6209 [Pedosphaera parvula Ellin514]